MSEDDPRLAMRANSAGPGRIALWAAANKVRMIHLSTDYVFDGEGSTPLREEMTPRPVSAYARSKFGGEQAVLTHPGNLVLRVSWVFGPDRPSFIDQIFDSAVAGRPLSAVADKLSLPTSTMDLVRWIEVLLGTNAQGILHACNSGPQVSWHGLATTVVREMSRLGILKECPEIEATTLAGTPMLRAHRPRFTVMDTSRLAAILGHAPRPWPEAIAEHVAAHGTAKRPGLQP